jgi:hypothetical protein
MVSLVASEFAWECLSAVRWEGGRKEGRKKKGE